MGRGERCCAVGGEEARWRARPAPHARSQVAFRPLPLPQPAKKAPQQAPGGGKAKPTAPTKKKKKKAQPQRGLLMDLPAASGPSGSEGSMQRQEQANAMSAGAADLSQRTPHQAAARAGGGGAQHQVPKSWWSSLLRPFPDSQPSPSMSSSSSPALLLGQRRRRARRSLLAWWWLAWWRHEEPSSSYTEVDAAQLGDGALGASASAQQLRAGASAGAAAALGRPGMRAQPLSSAAATFKQMQVCVCDFASVWTPRRGRSPTTGRIRCLAAQRQASQRHTHGCRDVLRLSTQQACPPGPAAQGSEHGTTRMCVEVAHLWLHTSAGRIQCLAALHVREPSTPNSTSSTGD